MGGLLHLVQRGGAWAGWGPAHCVQCSFNVGIKGLIRETCGCEGVYRAEVTVV